MHWRKKLSRKVSLKFYFVAYFFPSKFDQRDYRRFAIYYWIWINKRNIYGFFNLRALRMLVVFKITFINSEISRNFFFHFRILLSKLMIELKKIIGKHVTLDELYSEIFLIFRFVTLVIDISFFAFGQCFYRFSRARALLWSGGSIG